MLMDITLDADQKQTPGKAQKQPSKEGRMKDMCIKSKGKVRGARSGCIKGALQYFKDNSMTG